MAIVGIYIRFLGCTLRVFAFFFPGELTLFHCMFLGDSPHVDVFYLTSNQSPNKHDPLSTQWKRPELWSITQSPFFLFVFISCVDSKECVDPKEPRNFQEVKSSEAKDKISLCEDGFSLIVRFDCWLYLELFQGGSNILFIVSRFSWFRIEFGHLCLRVWALVQLKFTASFPEKKVDLRQLDIMDCHCIR